MRSDYGSKQELPLNECSSCHAELEPRSVSLTETVADRYAEALGG
jgi:hypothetical protein